MATLYVKDVPEELYKKLKEMAVRDRRSINAETIVLLESAIGYSGRAKDEIMASIEKIRSRYRLKPGKTLMELLREDRKR